ncbi:hypothetical protein ACTHQF_02840 [Pedobacter sp. SAFR-022]|uniref:hypothetical protein n=1 Tax=Pedobacter sp. SAFR-022 TaxID=3436861 RepID=UPI003F806191
MKKAFIFVASAALLFNLVSLILWLNAFWSTKTHEQAVARFENYLPWVYSTGSFYTLSILATIFSIIIYTRYKAAQNHTIFTSLTIIQASFLLLFTWQLL